MRRRGAWRAALAGALALALTLFAPTGALAAGDAPASGVAEKLGAVFEQYSTLGACVAVIENGKVTYTYCYGDRRIDGDPVTVDTGFQVGSIGKLVANIGLMQLVEQGKAGLESELGELLGFPLRSPFFPDTPITLRQLMTHTAALRDSRAYQNALDGGGLPLDELFSGTTRYSLFYRGYAPGEKSEYSNFGGGLIGSLIERLSGSTLDEYMTRNVFAPLDIRAGYQASLLWRDMPLADMYRMPQRRLAKELRADPTHITTPDPLHDYYLVAGKLIITAPDLAKLLIALCDGGVYGGVRLLKESTVAEMTTLQNHRGSVTCQSGRGLLMNILVDDQVQGRTMYGHGGKANGMLCAAYYDPCDRTGVVMLTNGCQNRIVRNGVGMLERAVMEVCYAELEERHVTENPFVVEE
ncbi:MAG: serine hydrolase domain-containing protein [Clostridia bacterium]